MPLPDPHTADFPAAQRNFEAIDALLRPQVLGLLFAGSGTPENAVTASPGALYLNTDGGASTTLYIKESGADTDTGWVAK